MTSPVQMDINDTVSTMSFVMSSHYNQANLPKPNNPDVILKEKQYEYVVVIQFSGFESDKELKVHSEKLQNIQNLVMGFLKRKSRNGSHGEVGKRTQDTVCRGK